MNYADTIVPTPHPLARTLRALVRFEVMKAAHDGSFLRQAWDEELRHRNHHDGTLYWSG